MKDTAVGFLGEGGKIGSSGRELFNIFNHPNFASPSKAASPVFAGTCPGTGSAALAGCTASVVNPSAAAGTITATNGTSRQIQFGLKILFQSAESTDRSKMRFPSAATTVSILRSLTLRPTGDARGAHR